MGRQTGLLTVRVENLSLDPDDANALGYNRRIALDFRAFTHCIILVGRDPRAAS
jgi:hypothetical protein